VLAVDSRVTLTAERQAGGQFTSHFDNATKLLAIEGQPYVGIATYGAGAIGHAEPRTAHSFIPEFEAELGAIYSDRATVERIARALSDFYHEQWQQAGMPADADPMMFLVAGFDAGEPYGKVYQVSIPDSLMPVEQSPSGFGVTFGGQAELAARATRRCGRAGSRPRHGRALPKRQPARRACPAVAGRAYSRRSVPIPAPAGLCRPLRVPHRDDLDGSRVDDRRPGSRRCRGRRDDHANRRLASDPTKDGSRQRVAGWTVVRPVPAGAVAFRNGRGPRTCCQPTVDVLPSSTA
jgi:hypothetical protein